MKKKISSHNNLASLTKNKKLSGVDCPEIIEKSTNVGQGVREFGKY